MNNYKSLLVIILSSPIFLMSGVFNFLRTQTDNALNDRITQIAWSFDGTLLASGEFDGYVRVIRQDTQETVFESTDSKQPIYSIAWQPDTHLLAVANYDGDIYVWNIADGKLLHQFSSRQGGSGLIWSMDGKKLIAGALEVKTLWVWDFQSGKLIYEKGVGSVGQMTWSPDGTQLAIANPVGIVTLLNSDTFEISRKFKVLEKGGQGGDVYSVAWHPNGQLLASGSLNGAVRIWDVNTGKLLQSLKGNEYPQLSFFKTTVHSLRFSPDGNYLTSISANGILRTWDTSTWQIVSDVDLQSDVSSAAWSQWGGQLAYAPYSASLQNKSNDLNIITSYFTVNNLKTLIDQCIVTSSTQQKLATVLEADQLGEFIRTLENLPETEIKSGCRSDLKAIANSLLK